MAVDPVTIKDEQHTRLLEGLAESIREKGLAGTQVGDIVRHARASRRTFYNHFPDKESCFVELANLTSRILLEHVSQAIDRDAPLETQVDQAIDAYLGALVAEPEINMTFSSPSLGERVVLAQRDAMERYAELLVSVVSDDAERDPSVAPVSFDRAYMLVSGLHGAVMRATARGEDPASLAGDIKALMKSALAGTPATNRA